MNNNEKQNGAGEYGSDEILIEVRTPDGLSYLTTKRRESTRSGPEAQNYLTAELTSHEESENAECRLQNHESPGADNREIQSLENGNVDSQNIAEARADLIGLLRSRIASEEIANDEVRTSNGTQSLLTAEHAEHAETKSNSGPAEAGTANLKAKQREGETDEEAFGRLARLTVAQYDRVRKSEAAILGIRVETLDNEVERLREEFRDQAKNGTVDLRQIEPWPEPVDGAQVLNEVSGRYSLYLVLPAGGADAMALWTAHDHAFEAFLQSPRLNLSSPERGCGKTTTLDVLASMTQRPLRTENLTAPTLFRVVDQHKPTLLLDEVDSYLNQAEELRGLLNAGHKRGACAYRCEGDGNTVRAFKAYAPAVLAGIGYLPGTLHDRSIAIRLVKALPGEIRERFEEHRAERERVLARKLARWAKDNFEALKARDPVLPETAYNRLADNWRPLFAIAEVAGGDWPQRALGGFEHLTAKIDEDTQGLGVRLLDDIRHIFTQNGVERIRSKDLVQGLCGLLDSPWPEAHKGHKPITETWLSQSLRRFGIRAQTLRVGEHPARGYALADFKEAFARFLR